MARATSIYTTSSPGLVRQEADRTEALHTLQRLRREARAEIERLIGFLDQSDTYVMTELEDDDDREQVGDEEPSLGSFDRMTNQEKSWRAVDRNPDVYGWSPGVDAEQDDCDYEDADPNEAKQQPPEMAPCA